MTDELETMRPNPAWAPDAYDETVDTLAAIADEATVHVWGGDWCPDCRSQLPDLAAAFEAAGIDAERLHEHPVDRDKDGDLVAEYGVEYIPTVVIERDGEELARFVESGDRPAAVELAEQLRAAGVVAAADD